MRLASDTGAARPSDVTRLVSVNSAHTDTASTECTPPEDATATFRTLNFRQRELEKRETALAERISAMAFAEQEIARNLAALKSAEAALMETMTLAENAADADLDQLTTVYENMKPKDAAPLFEKMPHEFAARFLARMRPDLAAALMADLSLPTAYSISVLLAGGNTSVPRK